MHKQLQHDIPLSRRVFVFTPWEESGELDLVAGGV